MAHRGDISRFLLKPDKHCIIAEYGLCYYMNNYIGIDRVGTYLTRPDMEEEIMVGDRLLVYANRKSVKRIPRGNYSGENDTLRRFTVLGG
jgi:hypothetical protein